MQRRGWRFAGVAVMVVALGVARQALGAAGAPAEDVGRLARDNTRFALDLYQRLAVTEGNLFFSPHSISTALAMTYAGARGETATQMAASLRFSLAAERLHPAFAGMAERLRSAEAGGGLALHVANALWPQRDAPLLDAYLELVKAHYGVSLRAVDYVQAAEDARRQINTWVEEMTNDKIRDLIPGGVLDALTRLVLVNAIYFKGDWASPFDAAATHTAPFALGADRTVEVPLMVQKHRFGYARLPEVEVLELPYAGEKLSMVLLLPAVEGGLARLEQELSVEALERWTGALAEREVLVYMPRFKMTSLFRLDEALQALGMRDAFDSGRADFSGMDGRKGSLYIGAALHKAFVEVNEEGTEAAAATAIIMRATAMPEPPPTFRADRPFLFLIREQASGAVLFMGRVADPQAGD